MPPFREPGAALAEQARGEGREVAQLDPPHRASRYFRRSGVLRSIQPDAFAALRREGERRPFFLEWERRAVRPSTMVGRLGPYLRYYASQRPADDHGVKAGPCWWSSTTSSPPATSCAWHEAS